MDYKLIAVDVDGTLTNSRKEITPRTRYALLEAQKQGKRVVIASGRQPMGVYPIARDLMLDRYNGYILSYNGGKIISCATDETVATKLFPREYLADIVSVLNDYNVTINTFDDKKIFSNSKVNDYTYIEQEVTHAEMIVCADFVAEVKFPFNKLLLAGEPLELDACQELLRKRYDGLLDIYKSAPYFLEIMPFGVSKGSMDNYNDMTMIGYAGMGVAMGNAEPEVKKIANYVCETNDEDGVAKTIEQMILSKA
ncbi:Cof-type HAD-IIB family hydrolase [uncultured Ruminococcus sp.]|uniref:Cof-type HAD-IIB family hydrolase n=1 Tax=uncultured Ruminococcus sp. TaxID=165186 RepID=UPI0029308A14|nr:Cof-type HAD-IIB family hydrolase [uncultured Ruminococcus sp.]